jgi:tetratricopeptide (TPR) repeat protein
MHHDKIRPHVSTYSSSNAVTLSSTMVSYLTMTSSTLASFPMIIQLNNEGVAFFQQGRLSDAMERYRSAKQLAVNNNNSIMPSRSSVHDDRTVFSRSTSPSIICDDRDLFTKKLYIYQREDYDEGMDIYNQTILLDPRQSNVRHSSVSVMATILYNFGHVNVRLGDDEDALFHFGQALVILEESFVPGHWAKEKTPATITTSDSYLMLAILHNISRIEYRNGRYEEAIRRTVKSLEYARTECSTCMAPSMSDGNDNQDHDHIWLTVAQTLNCLGVLNFHMPGADTSHVLSLFQESLAIRMTLFDSQTTSSSSGCTVVSKEVATTLNNIGRVYYMRGEHEQALQVYYQAQQMRRQLLGHDHLDVAATIYNIGQTHHQRGDLDQAMTLYNEFLTIARCRLGENHRDVAIMLKCIAQIHHEKGQFETAKQTYHEALRIGRSALGRNHPEVASTLNKLGNLLYETGDFQGAIGVYQEGLKVERAVLDVCHPNIVVTLTNIGQIYKLRGDYHAALKVYKEAASIQQNTIGPNHPDTAATLASIALIYFQTKEYSKALEVYQETLRIRRDAYGEDNLEVAASLNSIGLVLFKMELNVMALQSFTRSLDIRRRNLGAIHRDVAVILYNIATVCLELGDEEDAVQFYRETLKVEQASLGTGHRDVLLTMQHLGQVHQQRGEIAEALTYFHESLKIQLESPSKDAIHLASTYNQIGNMHLQRGDTANMVHAYSEALRLLRNIGKSERDMHINGMNFYGLSKIHPECAACA